MALSDLTILDQGEWIFYLTAPGESAILFESNVITIDYRDTVIFAIDDDPASEDLVIDQINTIYTDQVHLDKNTQANLRFYQSTDSFEYLDVYANNMLEMPVVDNLAPGSFSEPVFFSPGDHTFSVTHAEDSTEAYLSNLLMPLTAGEAKNVILYQNAQGEMQTLSVPQQNLPLAFENQLTIANLTEEEQGIDVYAINSTYSISDTPMSIKSLAYGTAGSMLIGEPQFQIVVTNTQQEDQQDTYILAESEVMTYEPEASYLILVEPDADNIGGFTITTSREF
ncbi:DUF4397 domain-containing protein [Thalassomonas viridans]|uniref:DUF4397 domain-containing protein n=1 Tax=Thalassomonas viridans TaxID=137584 RepID=A0AAE9ZA95_9GAMM|nr:DUF4397 domain-containing protein [Thalassomonas viridans]WDE09067.1 DUF4397 domain-containing protein [Thalassomonas viridans]